MKMLGLKTTDFNPRTKHIKINISQQMRSLNREITPCWQLLGTVT